MKSEDTWKKNEWLPPVDWTETRHIRFWRRLADYTQGKWLEANGWTRAERGWLLPDWHPRARRFWGAKAPNIISLRGGFRFKTAVRAPIAELKEPYDQNHAANSQRAHTNMRTVHTRHAKRRDAPAFPPYIKWWARLPVVQVLAIICLGVQLSVGEHWSRHLFFLAAVLGFCVSLYVSRLARKEWELEWAESQLARKIHGAYDSN